MEKKYLVYWLIILVLIAILVFVCLLYTGKITFPYSENNKEEIIIEPTNIDINYDSEDEDSNWKNASNITYINLKNSEIDVEGNGVSITETTAKITTAGTYHITGSLEDGSIVIEATNKDTVNLVLNNVNINCDDSSPIYVKQAEKAIITLETGSINTLTDGENYILESGEDEPNSTIFSKDDLTINGDGTLNITANYNNGITSKDELKIIDGVFIINSTNHGIKGKDYVAIKNGDFTIKSGGDAIKASEDTDTTKGYISIENGQFKIDATQDGIQAETGILIQNGIFDIITGGGSTNNNTNNQNWGMWGKQTTIEEDETSAKGIKAGNDITINDAEISINSSDDSIHSNGMITINNGEFKISSGDDGIHADGTVTINGGNISINKSYEGIEGENININGGNINIIANDDGINAAGGNDASALNGRPGQNSFLGNSNNKLTITNGYIVIDASGDGLDSNGAINVSGGTIIVNGPTNSGNGSLDYGGTFDMTGGILIAAGSAGMMQTISSSSTQYCIAIVFSNTQKADTIVNIKDDSENDIITFAPNKNYQSFIVCSPDLKKNTEYRVYIGGTYIEGNNADGILTQGEYENGTQYTTFTLNNIVTNVGNSNMAGMMKKR